MGDEVWKQLRLRVEQLGKLYAKVGVLESKGGNEPHDEGSITMTELAAIHEFGAPAANIPERSFIRSTFANRNPELEQLLERISKAVINGKLTPEAGLALLGQWGVSQVKKTITADEHIPPPLKPETIERKGSTRPLVDTGRLVGAINYEVGTGGDE